MDVGAIITRLNITKHNERRVVAAAEEMLRMCDQKCKTLPKKMGSLRPYIAVDFALEKLGIVLSRSSIIKAAGCKPQLYTEAYTLMENVVKPDRNITIDSLAAAVCPGARNAVALGRKILHAIGKSGKVGHSHQQTVSYDGPLYQAAALLVGAHEVGVDIDEAELADLVNQRKAALTSKAEDMNKLYNKALMADGGSSAEKEKNRHSKRGRGSQDTQTTSQSGKDQNPFQDTRSASVKETSPVERRPVGRPPKSNPPSAGRQSNASSSGSKSVTSVSRARLQESALAVDQEVDSLARSVESSAEKTVTSPEARSTESEKPRKRQRLSDVSMNGKEREEHSEHTGSSAGGGRWSLRTEVERLVGLCKQPTHVELRDELRIGAVVEPCPWEKNSKKRAIDIS